MSNKYTSWILRCILSFNIALMSFATPYRAVGPAIPVFPNSSRIIVIADVHADIIRFKDILRDAQVLDDEDRWIAQPNTIVVQLGDQIDPKAPDASDIDDEHHFKMIYFTEDLKQLAQKHQCDFISVIGNHELYNIDKIRKKDKLRDIIASRPVLVRLNEYIFCHGGFKAKHYSLLQFYDKSATDINDIWTKFVNKEPLLPSEEMLLNNLILDTENSILFTRIPNTKEDIDKLFSSLNVDYMFVGHTAFQYIHLKDKVWYLDLYLKDAFDNMIYSYLVIDGGNIMIKHLSDYGKNKGGYLLDSVLGYTFFS